MKGEDVEEFPDLLRFCERRPKPVAAEVVAGHWTQADLNTFKAFGVTPPGT